MRRLLHLLPLLFLVSCLNSGQKSNAKLHISAGFTITGLPGGVMVYVINKSTNTQKSISTQESTVSIPLENGSWEFVAIGWAGSTPLIGPLKCGRTSVNLGNGDVDVKLNISSAKCDHEYFSPSSFRASGITKDLRIVRCGDITNKSANDCDGAGQIGSYGYYKIKLLAHGETPRNNLGSILASQTPSLESSCLSQNAANSFLATTLKIPYGSSSFFPPTLIEKYSDNTCQSGVGKTSFYFPKGLSSGMVLPASTAITESGTGSYASYGNIFLNLPVELNLTTSSTNPGKIDLSWNSIMGAVSYNIYRGTTSGSLTLINNAATTTFVDNAANPGVQYYYSVKAIDSSNYEFKFSSEKTAMSINSISSITATASGPTSIIISWVSTTGASSYDIVYGTNAGGLTSSVTNVSSPATITGLSPNTSYDIAVKAKNSIGAGSSVQSSSSSIITPTVANLAANTNTFTFAGELVSNTNSQTFTITNNGGTSAGSLSFSMAGTDASQFSVSAPCTSLASTVSCTITVSFTPSKWGDANAYVKATFNDGVSTQNINVLTVKGDDSIATGTMSAYYSNAANWNTYAKSTDLFGGTTASQCAPDTDTTCQHGGELRVTSLPTTNGFSSCTGMTGEDSLMVFKWECVVESGVVKFRSVGLNPGKGLRDLVNATTWKQIQFKAKLSSILVYQTNLSNTWWTNTIRNLNGLHNASFGMTSTFLMPNDLPGYVSNTYPLYSFDLQTYNTIYTVSTNLIIPSFHIGAANVSLVTLPSYSISSNNLFATSICSSSTGGLTSADLPAIICQGGTAGAKHAWIEVNVTGGSSATMHSIVQVAPKFSRVHNTEISNGNFGLKQINSTKPNFVTGLYSHHNAKGVWLSGNTATTTIRESTITNNSSDGIYINNSSNFEITGTITKANLIGLSIANSSSNGRIGGLKSLFNTYEGVKVSNSTGIRIHDSILSYNGYRGLYFFGNTTTASNSFHNSTVSSNCTNTNATPQGAVEIEDSNENNIFNILSTANKCYALKIHHPSTQTNHKTNVHHSTFTNNYDGIYLKYSSYNYFMSIISSHNSIGGASTSGLFLSFATNNIFKNLVTTNNYWGINFLGTTSYNTFSNALLVGNNSSTTDCQFGSGTFTGNSVSTSNCDSTITIGSKSTDGSFEGMALSDDKNSDNSELLTNSGKIPFSNIDDFLNFSNPFRYWGSKATGGNTNPYTTANAYFCSSSNNCAIWDWRIKSGDSTIYNKSFDGNSSNTAFSGGSSCASELEGTKYSTDFRTLQNKFLNFASEILFDLTGDDDGLCESGESCIYSPNFGYYQGIGSFTSACTFYSGPGTGNITGVTLKAYQTN
jgi:hypothetical protein